MQYILSLLGSFLGLFNLSYPILDNNEGYIASSVDSYWEVEYNINPELFCLTEAIYYESKGEPLKGKVAVGKVILNRVRSSRFPDSICDVVYQPSNNPARPAACQFSFTCGKKVLQVKNLQAWDESAKVAAELFYGLIDIDIYAKHYVRCGIRRTWMKGMYQSKQIGNHCFYRRRRI